MEKTNYYVNEYAKQSALKFDGIKQMKINSVDYNSHASLLKYLKKGFASNLPIKSHELLSACQIHSSDDSFTQNIPFSPKNIVYFRMRTLKERWTAHSGAVFTPWDNKTFLIDTNCFWVPSGLLHNYTSMYIYCDAVKCQISADTRLRYMLLFQFKGHQISIASEALNRHKTFH